MPRRQKTRTLEKRKPDWRHDLELDGLALKSGRCVKLGSHCLVAGQDISDHYTRDHGYLNHEDRTVPPTRRIEILEHKG
ncbi:hypothetical protein J1614_002919 [Plenodomus biglobosus]|nr:hypothetical protein J1614_002919 [Plenodomus biglobosus]